MRPEQNHSQTVALMNQLLDGYTFEAHTILLNEGEHFAHSLTLRAVGRSSSLLLFTEYLQGFANHILGCAEVAGLQLLFYYFFLLRRQIDFHRPKTPSVPMPHDTSLGNIGARELPTRARACGEAPRVRSARRRCGRIFRGVRG